MATTNYKWLDKMEIVNEIQGMSSKIGVYEYSTKKEYKEDLTWLKELIRELEKATKDGLEYNPNNR